MKLLFLSYHFPGPLMPLATWLAARGHEILYASNRSPQLQKPLSDGIKRVILKRFSLPAKTDAFLDILENAQVAARYAASSFLAIKESGFIPDFVFTASSGGAALAVPSIYPERSWLNFVEMPARDGLSKKDRMIQVIQIALAAKSFVFYPGQIGLFPPIPANGLSVFKPVVDTSFFSPELSQKQERLAVFFNLRNPLPLLSSFLNVNSGNNAVWLTGNAKKAQAEMAGLFPENRLQILPASDPVLLRSVFRRGSLAFFEFPGEMVIQAMASQCAAIGHKSISRADLPEDVIQMEASGEALSAMLDDQEKLGAYSTQCLHVARRDHSAAKILPVWFRENCPDLQA